MANYFVINNKFKPYSFDELIKPYQIYGQAYKEQEDTLNQLESNAATVESALSETNDPVAYATYKNYLDNVKSVAGELASSGLNPSIRRRASQLSTDYNERIVPIQAAFNRRKELQDEQRKALLTNPTLYYQRNFNDVGNEATSIDRFIENPNYDYGNFFSGALLEKQVADAASVLAKELHNYDSKKLDSYTNLFMQKYGFSRKEVLEAINNPDSPTSSPILKAIVDSVVEGSGVPTWGDSQALQSAYNYARRGLIHAIGEDKLSTYDNYGARLTAQKAAAASQPTITGLPINPLNFYTQKERDEASDIMKRYGNYFTEGADGKYRLTEEGKKEYNRKVNYNTGKTLVTPEGTTISTSVERVTDDTAFKKWIDSQNNNGKSPEEVWTDFMNAHDDSRYDATRRTEYDYTYTKDNKDQMKSAVIEAASNTPLKVVDFDIETNSWKETGQEIPLDKFTSDYEILSSRRSYGNTQMIITNKKTGETARVAMPKGINRSAEYKIMESEQNASKYLNAFNTLVSTGIYNGKKLSEDEYNEIMEGILQGYNEALTNMYLYWSQLGVSYDLAPQKVNPYVF